MLEGLSFLGAEREVEYAAIARARIGYYFAQSSYAAQSIGAASDGVAVQQKSDVAAQKKTSVPIAPLRSLRNLPKRG
jgi:hypothetical protein